MLISVLIMAVFTVAAGVLLFTTPVDADAPSADNGPGLSIPGDDGNDSMDGIHPVPPPPPTTQPTTEPPPPPLEVTSLTITYDGSRRTEFTAKIGEQVPLRVKIEPVGVETPEIIWSSSNPDVFAVVPVEIDGSGVTVTGIGRGTATLTVAAGGIEEKCTVHVS
jgi:hypothetical protein